jgi:transposase
VRENDGRKLDHRTLEVLRLRAVEQVQAGTHPEDVAQALGLHRKTVYGWLAKFREGGRDALVAKPVPGRPPKPSGAQIARLYQLIVGSDPAQFSFEFALWTRDMVRQVIRREFKFALSVVSAARDCVQDSLARWCIATITASSRNGRKVVELAATVESHGQQTRQAHDGLVTASSWSVTCGRWAAGNGRPSGPLEGRGKPRGAASF